MRMWCSLNLERNRRTMVIKLLATFLLIVAAYSGWWAVSAAAWFWLLLSMVALIGAIGLYLHKRWAQYFWHGIALVACVWWGASVLQVAISGWPQQSIVSSLISLLPGLLLLTVCIGGSFVIAKHYRRASNAL
jgi:hypothetical protein